VAQLGSLELDKEDAMVMLEAQLEGAKMEAKRDGQLYEGGISSKIQWDTSVTKQTELETRVGLSKKHLGKMKGSSEAALVVQRATVEQFIGLLKLKEKQHADLAVTSRDSGIVKQVLIEVGQQITSATSLAQMAKPGSLKAELNIPETQIRDVMVGQTVWIDTHNGGIDGVVERIDPAVLDGTDKNTGADSGTNEIRAQPTLNHVIPGSLLSGILHTKTLPLCMKR
jgi:multidrug resistance efflux pump